MAVATSRVRYAEMDEACLQLYYIWLVAAAARIYMNRLRFFSRSLGPFLLVDCRRPS